MKKASKVKDLQYGEDYNGPLMVYKPMTPRELEKITKIIEARKAQIAAQKKAASKA